MHLEAARALAMIVDNDPKGHWDWFHEPHDLYLRELDKCNGRK